MGSRSHPLRGSHDSSSGNPGRPRSGGGRTKPDWYYRQSGVIPLRNRYHHPSFLLITSRKGSRWLIPKGIVEPSLSPRASAAQEALEEAGIRGSIEPTPLGRYRYRKWGGMCTVTVFVMDVTEVLDDWPEASSRRRRWVAAPDAARLLSRSGLKRLVRRLARNLQQPPNNPEIRAPYSP